MISSKFVACYSQVDCIKRLTDKKWIDALIGS